MPDQVQLQFVSSGQTRVVPVGSDAANLLIGVIRGQDAEGVGNITIEMIAGLRAELNEIRALAQAGGGTPPPVATAPTVTTAAVLVPETGPVGTTFTLSNGTYAGTPTPQVTRTLTQNGVNVTSQITDNKFTSTAQGPLVLTVTATNSAGSITVTDSSTVTSAEPQPGPGTIPQLSNFPKTGVRQIHSGHSLTDALFQFGNSYIGTYQRLAESIGITDVFNSIRKSTIPGSSTTSRWEAGVNQFGTGDNARYDIRNYNLLSITERGPVALPYSDNMYTEQELQGNINHLKLFIQNARQNGANGAGARTFLYTMWPNIDDSFGPFRPMLDSYERAWHYMQERINADLGGYLHIIPGHRVMMRIFDDIQAGLVPGITDIHQLFLDDIHPNGWGAYPISCLHIAVIYGHDPRTLPYNFVVRSDAMFETPPAGELMSEALATYMRTVAYDVARTYARAGRGGTDAGLAGVRPTPALQTPREILGNRLRLAVDYGTGPDGPVGSITGDGVTLIVPATAQQPIRQDGYLRFPGNAMMHGSVTVSGPRYMLRLMRINARVGQYLDTSFMFNVNDVGWQGQHQMIQENLNSSFGSSSPDIGTMSVSRELGQFWLIEKFWGTSTTWGRVQDRDAARSIAVTNNSFPSTIKIQVGGTLDGGTFVSPNYFFSNVDLVADIVADSMPTEQERFSLIHWARSILSAGAAA